MASIFTFQEEPHRVQSPWSTPGSATPQKVVQADLNSPNTSQPLMRLEPERQDGPTEYKLHLLLRPRRTLSTMSTTNLISGSYHSKSTVLTPSTQGANGDTGLRTAHQPSTNTRQARLQQLTTQLLWRLQQSSPFHSSSNADLVLPVLPEATPKLGVPDRPSKLLSGLEESQGALYEIGVADDGTLVGITTDELEESLINLRAMAASIGCVVDVLRRVVVGQCEWLEDHSESVTHEPIADNLWVAEVLVRPDNKSVEVVPAQSHTGATTFKFSSEINPVPVVAADSEVEQFRLAIIGPTASGKSSLLGTLTTSTLDNGRGKSRLALLKHRHEIASGVTSSVAQELLGYRDLQSDGGGVVNYASGDVSSWPDIHNLATRLLFLSDSPGLPRYAKSTFRTLLSWDPAWVILCVSADDDEVDKSRQSPTFDNHANQSQSCDLSLAYLELCLKLSLPFLVVITKMDLATKTGLRSVLSKILSIVKSAGKTPALLSAPSAAVLGLDDVEVSVGLTRVGGNELAEISRLTDRLRYGAHTTIVPIIMTSAVSGAGIGKLHTVLQQLPYSKPEMKSLTHVVDTLFSIDEVFAIPPSKVYSRENDEQNANRGAVLCGHVRRGALLIGAEFILGPFLVETSAEIEGPQQPQIRGASLSKQQNIVDQQSLPETLSKSFPQYNPRLSSLQSDGQVRFVKVRVVSLRNLRLPVRSLRAGQTGTVGVQAVELIDGTPSLVRARKGMVLRTSEVAVSGYRSFVVSFPASDFGNAASPPLILGGHAIAYINSIRAAVKVTAMALDEDEMDDLSAPVDMLSFQDDSLSQPRLKDIHLTLRLVSTMEWMEVGDKVLLVPTLSASGPVTGLAVNVTGLSGFVGRVYELYS